MRGAARTEHVSSIECLFYVCNGAAWWRLHYVGACAAANASARASQPRGSSHPESVRYALFQRPRGAGCAGAPWRTDPAPNPHLARVLAPNVLLGDEGGLFCPCGHWSAMDS
jgi:hypothetical protein